MREYAELATKDSHQCCLIFGIRAMFQDFDNPSSRAGDGALCCSLLRCDAPLVRREVIILVIL
jgi:hypothetical protein